MLVSRLYNTIRLLTSTSQIPNQNKVNLRKCSDGVSLSNTSVCTGMHVENS